MKLACGDFTFPLLSHRHALDLIGMLGFDGVDIGLFEGRSHLRPSRELKNPDRSGRKLWKMIDERGLRTADVFLQLDPDFTLFAANHPMPSRRRKARDWFRRTLDYTAACEAKHVTSLPGARFDGEPLAESRARCADEMAWRVERAEEAGLIFGVEPHIGSITPRPRDALRLLRDVPGLTLTLDYTHFIRRGIPERDVDALLPHAGHFHVRGARKGRLQASFADNTIDYARIMKRLKANRYRGYVVVEYVWTEWERCNDVDNLSETVLFRDFLRRLR